MPLASFLLYSATGTILWTALLATARTAFTDGLQAMALTSALIMVGLAALVMALRRDLGATTDRQPPPDRAPDAAVVPTA